MSAASRQVRCCLPTRTQCRAEDHRVEPERFDVHKLPARLDLVRCPPNSIKLVAVGGSPRPPTGSVSRGLQAVPRADRGSQRYSWSRRLPAYLAVQQTRSQ
jgi:hypothetical protein